MQKLNNKPPLQGTSYQHSSSGPLAPSDNGLPRNAAAPEEEDVFGVFKQPNLNNYAWSFPSSSASKAGTSFEKEPRSLGSTGDPYAFGQGWNGPSQPMGDAVSSVSAGLSMSVAPTGKQFMAHLEYGDAEIVADVYGVAGDIPLGSEYIRVKDKKNPLALIK